MFMVDDGKGECSSQLWLQLVLENKVKYSIGQSSATTRPWLLLLLLLPDILLLSRGCCGLVQNGMAQWWCAGSPVHHPNTSCVVQRVDKIIHVDSFIVRPNQRGLVVFFVYIPRHKCYGIVEHRLET